MNTAIHFYWEEVQNITPKINHQYLCIREISPEKKKEKTGFANDNMFPFNEGFFTPFLASYVNTKFGRLFITPSEQGILNNNDEEKIAIFMQEQYLITHVAPAFGMVQKPQGRINLPTTKIYTEIPFDCSEVTDETSEILEDILEDLVFEVNDKGPAKKMLDFMSKEAKEGPKKPNYQFDTKYYILDEEKMSGDPLEVIEYLKIKYQELVKDGCSNIEMEMNEHGPMYRGKVIESDLNYQIRKKSTIKKIAEMEEYVQKAQNEIDSNIIQINKLKDSI